MKFGENRSPSKSQSSSRCFVHHWCSGRGFRLLSSAVSTFTALSAVNIEAIHRNCDHMIVQSASGPLAQHPPDSSGAGSSLRSGTERRCSISSRPRQHGSARGGALGMGGGGKHLRESSSPRIASAGSVPELRLACDGCSRVGLQSDEM